MTAVSSQSHDALGRAFLETIIDVMVRARIRQQFWPAVVVVLEAGAKPRVRDRGAVAQWLRSNGLDGLAWIVARRKVQRHEVLALVVCDEITQEYAIPIARPPGGVEDVPLPSDEVIASLIGAENLT